MSRAAAVVPVFLVACFPGPLELGPDGADATTRSDTSGEEVTAASDTETHEDLVGDDSDVALDATGVASSVSASTDRAGSIEVRWSAAANATSYRVERCPEPCEGSWSESATVAVTSWLDEDVEVPSIAVAPLDPVATTMLPDRVEVTWSAVVAPPALRYLYRVIALGTSGEAAPSETVEGHVAERPVTGYEVRVDEGTWTSVTTNGWTDVDAGAPTLTAGIAAASQGTSSSHVSLSASTAIASPGAERTYQVRTVTSYGWSDASPEVIGHRQAGVIGYQWERSAGASAEDFAPIAGATSTLFDDADAPADGATRWYRVIARADGAPDATSEPVAGARQGPPDVPAAVQASSNLVDRIEVSWQPVSGALGYHIYRDGAKLTTGNGVVATSYSDTAAPAPTESWSPPSGVTATTDDFDKVVVSWVAPVRPVGAATTYRVSAVNPAGEGPQSSEAIGRRVAVALVGYDVEVTPSGGNAQWSATSSVETTWNHLTAPAGVIAPGTIAASQASHRAFVRVVAPDALVDPATTVGYRVRGVLSGAATTAPSANAVGQRAVGGLTLQWDRSDDDVTYVQAGEGSPLQDTEAPPDGSKRWYRARLSASGAASTTTAAVQGWRLAFGDVHVGGSMTCALTTPEGKPWCWGEHRYREGGLDGASTLPERLPLPAGVGSLSVLTVGDTHACGLAPGGSVWCWGDNSYGTLGDGTTQDRTGWTMVEDLGGVAFAINGAVEYSCSAVGAGQARCWGNNISGQLGYGNVVDELSLVPVTVLTSSTTELSQVLTVVAGSEHACARRSGGLISCWGLNMEGQIGIGSGELFEPFAKPIGSLTNVAELALGTQHTCARLGTGAVYCWGLNSSGQVGQTDLLKRATPTLVTELPNVVDIAASAFSTCAATSSGAVYCWGSDANGQLGNGSTLGNSATPTAVPMLASTRLGGGASARHFCAVVDYGLQCWGANGSGQLGDGTTQVRPSPIEVELP